jgi:NADPH2:quinone reductase
VDRSVRAVVLSETGGPERLELREVPEPAPEQGSALVRVRAAGINFLDVLVRQGRYPQAPPLPAVPGAEVAGEIDGRRVIGFTGNSGGYAEQALVDERWLVPLPEKASFVEGASFLMTFLTVWLPLTRQVTVRPGSTVLVHAAAGGVGSAAVQVARYLGARVVATASTDEKRTVARDLGADEAYGYDDFAERVRADVVVDPVGGNVFSTSLTTLKPLGVIVAIGYAGGLWEDLNPALLVGRNIGVEGFYLGRLMAREPGLVREAIDEIVPLWESGAFRPLVGAEYPLEQAADAHRLIEERRSTGKVVLVP